MEAIHASEARIVALVFDGSRRLLVSVTDGDVRRVRCCCFCRYRARGRGHEPERDFYNEGGDRRPG